MRVVIARDPIAGDPAAVQAEVDDHQLAGSSAGANVGPDVLRRQADRLHA